MSEIELYPALKTYFENLGFVVRSEVRDIDVVAKKDDLLIGIEMKLNLSIALLTQAALRQKTCDLVYLAVPKPKRVVKNKTFKNLLYLLRRLELGLLYVDTNQGCVTEVIEPTFYDLNAARRQKMKEKLRILKEIKGRSIDGNQGGSRGKKLLTAYREDSLRTVALLQILNVISPKELTKYHLNKTLLQKDYYGWFERVDRGKYSLRETIHIEEEFLPYVEVFKREYESILLIEKGNSQSEDVVNPKKKKKESKKKGDTELSP